MVFDIASWGLWLFLDMEKLCWPWWYKVKGMSCWKRFIAPSYASIIVTWWFLEAFHIWSHVDDITEFDATLDYLTLLLDDEYIHVAVIMKFILLLSDGYVADSYMVNDGYWWLSWFFYLIIMVPLFGYKCNICLLM